MFGIKFKPLRELAVLELALLFFLSLIAFGVKITASFDVAKLNARQEVLQAQYDDFKEMDENLLAYVDVNKMYVDIRSYNSYVAKLQEGATNFWFSYFYQKDYLELEFVEFD